MPKLRFKRTPQEEATHQLRKGRKRQESKKRRGCKTTVDDPLANDNPVTDDVEAEERQFRQKMFDAFEDDERLDYLEARLNDYAHVPRRWRAKSSLHDPCTMDEFLEMDPRHMDDEDYAEWVRLGMYRKTHRKEYAEQQERKALYAQRKRDEKQRKEELKRLEKATDEARTRKKAELEHIKWCRAREEYDRRWERLLDVTECTAGSEGSLIELRFTDIPWPIMEANHVVEKHQSHRSSTRIGPDNLTLEAISKFLLYRGVMETLEKKERREVLRKAYLRFHPDKFEGRFMERIRHDHRERVKEAIVHVTHCLNALLGGSG